MTSSSCTGSSRRRFLRLMATSAGAAAGSMLLPPSIRQALATPAHRASGSIRDVGHVVILMQENRSFDHYFGTLRGVRGFNDPRPHLLPDGRPVWYQPPARSKTKRYHDRGVPDDAAYVLPFYLDPRTTTEHQNWLDHGWNSGHLAWNQGRYDQWVEQKQDPLTMGYLKREDLRFHYALADAFTVCDGYHSSIHGATAMNRMYLWSGTCDPRNAYGTRPTGPGMDERMHVNGYTWTTYPERLEAHGISWKLYQGGSGQPGTPTDNFTDNALEYFARYQVAEGADPLGPLVRKGASTHTLAELRDDVLHDRLPQVTWIVPPKKYSEHPSASPSDGADYINQVLEALVANPAVWSRTVLFLNYDENDGLFDHVVPPMPPLTSWSNGNGMVSDGLRDSLDDEFLDLDRYPGYQPSLVPGADPGGLQPIGLGPRVPMVVVSPWTTGGWVCSQTFDHTSVLQFLEARFGVAEPNISAWRRAVCGDLLAAFDFAGPPDRRIHHFHPPAALHSANAPFLVPAAQAMPVQEPGVRPARALPYAFAVQGREERAAGRFWLDFDNAGRAGAAFYVYDNMAPERAPRRYTVSAGDRLSDYWVPAPGPGAYDLTVRGPNGYLGHFRGSVGAGSARQATALEVQLQPDTASGRLVVQLRNSGTDACRCRIRNAYVHENPRDCEVAGGASVESAWQLDASAGWYDLIIDRPGDPLYLRRFAGHVENGRPSTSDPGPVSPA
ncbi:phosphocholine-specific phospholipase C [Rhodanobacter sp. Si-c]|uniref:phospholipase C n=1 Tax=Rhodanobacter lycopersici TaxID=3162487 RepID=A0ABV3QBL6_9GAMM